MGVDWVWIRGRAIRGRGVVGIWFERGLVGVVCHRPPKYDSPVWLSNRDALHGVTQPRGLPPSDALFISSIDKRDNQRIVCLLQSPTGSPPMHSRPSITNLLPHPAFASITTTSRYSFLASPLLAGSPFLWDLLSIVVGRRPSWATAITSREGGRHFKFSPSRLAGLRINRRFGCFVIAAR